MGSNSSTSKIDFVDQDAKTQPIFQATTMEAPSEVIKKEPIRRVYLWEMIRYLPDIFFKLECVSKQIKTTLESDVSYFQYYLEEMHRCDDVRTLSFSECKTRLQDELQFKPPGVYHIRLAVDETKESGQDRSGWYLSTQGSSKDSDARDQNSVWAILAKPGISNRAWSITKTHEDDVYQIIQAPDNSESRPKIPSRRESGDHYGWVVCSHRFYSEDKRNDSSTYAMLHNDQNKINGSDGGIWKITRGKGGFHQISYAHDDFRFGRTDQSGWYVSGGNHTRDENSTFVTLEKEASDCFLWKITPRK